VAETERLEPPPLVQTLMEVVGRQLGMGMGRGTLEIRFEDGRVRDCFRHFGPIGPGALRAYDELPAEPVS
jgi:hypothetical protein